MKQRNTPRVRLIAISASSFAVWHSEIDHSVALCQSGFVEQIIVLFPTSSQLYALGFRAFSFYFCFVDGLKCAAAADAVLFTSV
jgi:hypothetical protein